VVPKVSHPVPLSSVFSEICRCNARPENLDGSGTHRRTKAITDYIIGTWNPNIVWTDFGLRADILVRLNFRNLYPSLDFDLSFTALHA
jgi:hypothetical protein